MYGCENWTIKKVECRRIDTSELWCWRLLRSLGLQGDPTSPFKGNQSWIFIGRTGAETETNTLATWCEELTHKKRPWCWERLKAGEGNNRGWDGWMASLSQWTWVWVNSGVGDRQGSLACCSPWGHQESNTTERLNWTDLILYCPLLLLPSIFPRIRVFSNESALHIRWSKYWSFSIGPSNEYWGLPHF